MEFADLRNLELYNCEMIGQVEGSTDGQLLKLVAETHLIP